MRGGKSRGKNFKTHSAIHTSPTIKNHSAMLDEITSNPKKYKVYDDFTHIDRERKIGGGRSIFEPDLVFHHAEDYVTVVEACTSPYPAPEREVIQSLRIAKEHFAKRGVRCRLLRAYMDNGELKVREPAELIDTGVTCVKPKNLGELREK